VDDELVGFQLPPGLDHQRSMAAVQLISASLLRR
jgi:hypothetical protein